MKQLHVARLIGSSVHCFPNLAQAGSFSARFQLIFGSFSARRLDPKLVSLELENLGMELWLGSLELGNFRYEFGSARSSSEIFGKVLARLARASRFFGSFHL